MKRLLEYAESAFHGDWLTIAANAGRNVLTPGDFHETQVSLGGDISACGGPKVALSGKYTDWSGIELALRAEGYPEARGELDSRFKRDWLNRLCKQARGKLVNDKGTT